MTPLLKKTVLLAGIFGFFTVVLNNACVLGDSHPCGELNGKIVGCENNLTCVRGWCLPRFFLEITKGDGSRPDGGGLDRIAIHPDSDPRRDRSGNVENAGDKQTEKPGVDKNPPRDTPPTDRQTDRGPLPEGNCPGRCPLGESQPCYPAGTKGCTGSSCVGVCKSGKRFCHQVGLCSQWSSCFGAVVPVAEECNGQDDDCNGKIDEDLSQRCYDGPAGTKGVGLCREGSQSCVGGNWGACENAVKPVAELCDNQDNDCDGAVDEELVTSCYSGPAGTKGVGTCKDGKQTCTAGKWSGCVGEKLPASESCDNRDDDCNGKIDDGLSRKCFSGPTSRKGVGICKEGDQTCVAGKWGACVGEILPASSEPCDGKDNDCDGQTDEGCQCLAGKTQVCGATDAGECKKGQQTCDSKGKWGVCVGEVKGKAEECNGKDDDCDGSVDESLSRACYTGASGTDGKGLCKKGSQVCVAGKWGACVGEVLPLTEVCDGKDNDCDGTVDEGISRSCYTGASGTSGKGICKSGTQACAAGQWGACVGQVTPLVETCNNRDDDCDGTVDEGLTRACYSGPAGTQGRGSCKGGTQTCAAGAWGACKNEVVPVTEACNGKDDNCDGRVDNNYCVYTVAGSGKSGFKDGPALQAEFKKPEHLFLDLAGNLFISDEGGVIRVLDKSGNVNTYTGIGVGWSMNPTSTIPSFGVVRGLLALDNIYASTGSSILQMDRGVVSVFAGSGGAGYLDGVGKQAQFDTPWGLAFGGKGTVLVADRGNNAIRSIDVVSGVVKTVYKDAQFLPGVLNVNSGTLYIAGGLTGIVKLHKLDLQNKILTEIQTTSSVSLDVVLGVTSGSLGDLYLSGDGTPWVLKVDAQGKISTIAGSSRSGYKDGLGNSALFGRLSGMVLDKNARTLYIADSDNFRVRKIILP